MFHVKKQADSLVTQSRTGSNGRILAPSREFTKHIPQTSIPSVEESVNCAMNQ